MTDNRLTPSARGRKSDSALAHVRAARSSVVDIAAAIITKPVDGRTPAERRELFEARELVALLDQAVEHFGTMDRHRGGTPAA